MFFCTISNSRAYIRILSGAAYIWFLFSELLFARRRGDDDTNPSDFRQNQPGYTTLHNESPVPFSATGHQQQAPAATGYFDNPGYDPTAAGPSGDDASGAPRQSRRKRHAANRPPGVPHKTPVQEILSPSDDDDLIVAVPGPLHGTLLPQQHQQIRGDRPAKAHGRRTRRRAYHKGSVVPCSAPASLPAGQQQVVDSEEVSPQPKTRRSRRPAADRKIDEQPADGNASFEVTTDPDESEVNPVSSDDEILTMDHSICLDDQQNPRGVQHIV